MDNLTIRHDADKHKFFVIINGKEALMEYRFVNKNTLDYCHTFTPPELRGKGIAEKVVKFALVYAETNHYKVIPSCPYVAKLIAHNPAYQSLLVK